MHNTFLSSSCLGNCYATVMQWICIDAYSNSCTNEALLPYSDVLQRTLPNGLMGS